MLKKSFAEFIGTFVLVVFGCGVAVATGCEGNAGVVATAIAFGLVIVAMASIPPSPRRCSQAAK